MEVIKTSPNVEFDVIYADGTRKRVQEGVLFGTEKDGAMILHNGTDRAAVWFAAADAMLVALNECGALSAFVLNSLMETQSFKALKKLAEEVNRNIWLRNPATFRLGQMDFQRCAADMLEATAEDSDDPLLESALRCAAEMILQMEIPGGAE